MMLDDIAVLRDRDPSDVIGSAQNSWRQLTNDFHVDLNGIEHQQAIDKIAYFGMGGSALGAMLFSHWQYGQLPVSFNTFRQYDIPAWVDHRTLAIVASYSGNTEEPLSAFEQLKERGIRMVTITQGGQLAELARENNLPCYLLPEMLQPRMATCSMLRAIAEIVEGLDIQSGMIAPLTDAAERLPETTAGWGRETPTVSNYAKQLAEYCMGKTVIIYGGPLMAAAAYKWKIGFNENAKNLAFCNEWPEASHNELVGWTSHPIEKPFAVIELKSSFERIRIGQRIEIANRLLSGMMPEPKVVECYGQTAIEQLLWAVMLGDHVSTYLGLINGHNPAPVKIVEKFKQELADLDNQ